MKYCHNFALASLLVMSIGCKERNPLTDVVIETDLGDIEIDLYDDTPLHKANFIKLAKDGFYEDLLFHRVIKDFMIQGGDPLSRDAEKEIMLGDGDTDYKIESEIVFPKYFHRRGALAAARKQDQPNGEKKSSGCQFYIVWGRPTGKGEIIRAVREKNETLIQKRVNELYSQSEERVKSLEAMDDLTPLNIFTDSIRNVAKTELEASNSFYYIPDSIADIYTNEAGVPWLDQDYTVFGQVVEGLEIIEQIQNMQVDGFDRPLDDIKFNIEVIR